MATSGSFIGNLKCDDDSISGKYLTFLVEWQRNSFDTAKLTSNITIKGSVQSSSSKVHPYNKINKPSVELLVGGKKVTPSIKYIDTRNKVKCVFATWTGNVTHNADGTLDNLKIELNFELPGDSVSLNSGNASAYLSLDRLINNTVPILSHSECNIGDVIGITLNRTNDSYIHKLLYSYADNEGEIVSNAETYYGWTIPDSFIDSIVNAPNDKVTIKCITYSGEDEIGTAEVSFTANVPKREDTLPVIALAVYPDNSDFPSEVAEKNTENYVKGKTRIGVDTRNSETKRGAVFSLTPVSWIITYPDAITFDSGFKEYDAAPKQLENIIIDPPRLSGKTNISVTVTDSRGFTASTEKEITVIDYQKPVIKAYDGESSIIVTRGYMDGDNPVSSAAAQGLYVKVKKVCSLAGNSCTLKAEIMRIGDENGGKYTEIASDINGTQSDPDNIVTVFDSSVLERATLYLVRLTVTDLFGESGTYETVVPAASCTIHEGKGGKHLGLGGFCDYGFNLNGEYTDVWWTLRDHKGVMRIPYVISDKTELDEYADTLSFDGFYRIVYDPPEDHNVLGNKPLLIEGFKCSNEEWQRAVNYASSAIYVRTKSETEWTAWKTINI